MYSHARTWEPGKNQHQKSVNQEMKDAEKSMIFITPGYCYLIYIIVTKHTPTVYGLQLMFKMLQSLHFSL